MIKSACHDSQAEDYDSKLKLRDSAQFDYLRENYFKIHDRVIELLNIKRTDRILDIGIGTGLLEEKIDKKCMIAGIDISKKMLGKAAQKSLTVELKEGSFLSIPYADETFDSVVSCFAFHHLENGEKRLALKEVYRVLKQNGKLILADFMYWDKKARKQLKYRFREEKREDMIVEMKEENFTDIEWFTGLLDKCRLEAEFEQMATISWIAELRKTGAKAANALLSGKTKC